MTKKKSYWKASILIKVIMLLYSILPKSQCSDIVNGYLLPLLLQGRSHALGCFMDMGPYHLVVPVFVTHDFQGG